jgi:hypothetical protein
MGGGWSVESLDTRSPGRYIGAPRQFFSWNGVRIHRDSSAIGAAEFTPKSETVPSRRHRCRRDGRFAISETGKCFRFKIRLWLINCKGKNRAGCQTRMAGRVIVTDNPNPWGSEGGAHIRLYVDSEGLVFGQGVKATIRPNHRLGALVHCQMGPRLLR